MPIYNSLNPPAGNTPGLQFCELHDDHITRSSGEGSILPRSVVWDRLRDVGASERAELVREACQQDAIRGGHDVESAEGLSWLMLENALLDSAGGDDLPRLYAELDHLFDEAQEKLAARDEPPPAGLPDFIELFRRAVAKDDDATDRPTVLPKSTIFHHLNKLGVWEQARAARVACEHRMIATGIPRNPSKQHSWRLLESALYDSLGGKCPRILDARLKAMHAGETPTA